MSLASPAVRGDGSGNVCCLAGVEREKRDIWWEQVGPSLEPGWIAFKDSLCEMAELQGARMAHAVHLT